MIGKEVAERLEVRIGLCTTKGRRPQNEDYAGIYTGTDEEQGRFGIIAAIADGVGGARGGRIAAELGVRCYIDGYLSQSETLGVQRAGIRSIEAVNSWIHGMGRSDPALEGMACGVPVVASRRGALPEICATAAVLVEPDADGLSEGLHRVLTDEGLARGLGVEGRERSALFTWENAARQHLAVYDLALAPG